MNEVMHYAYTMKCEIGAHVWYLNSSPDSIKEFDKLCQPFTQKFSTSKNTKRNMASFLITKERHDKSLRDFLKLFNEALF